MALYKLSHKVPIHFFYYWVPSWFFLMHAGFAFLEVGTVRQKNQVNALVKIIADFGISAIAYFFYWLLGCLWRHVLF